MTPAEIALLKERLASLEDFDVLDENGKDRWSVGLWCADALSYINALEHALAAQNGYLRLCLRPVIVGRG
jgi:hypothetical protein